MKKFFVAVLFSFFFLSHTPNVFAHGANMPPYFKINGKYSDYYSVQSTSVDNLILPQDKSPELVYLVNQPIDFEIDTTQLPFPPEILSKVKFDWDYGDGSPHSHGLKNTHTYTKIGSIIIHIEASEGAGEFETVLLNIVPNLNYHLPQALIKINGDQKSEFGKNLANTTPEGLRYTVAIHPGDVLHYDASSSTSPDSPLTEYFWDFGDGEIGHEQSMTHAYDNRFHLLFPVLRVKNADGFFADSFTTIDDDDKNPPIATLKSSPSPSNTTNQSSILNPTTVLFVLIGVVGVVGLLVFLLTKKK